MTIDEAIADNLRIAEGQGKCAEISASEHAKERIKVCADEHRQIAEWLRELKELREKYSAQIEVIGFLKSDNKQLDEHLKKAKRLLKIAVEDIHDVLSSQIKITNYTLCEKCKHYLNCNCKDKCITRYNLKQWRFADEALKLIGETNDEP